MYFIEIFAIKDNYKDGNYDQQQAEEARQNVIDKRSPVFDRKTRVFQLKADSKSKVKWSFDNKTNHKIPMKLFL